MFSCGCTSLIYPKRSPHLEHSGISNSDVSRLSIIKIYSPPIPLMDAWQREQLQRALVAKVSTGFSPCQRIALQHPRYNLITPSISLDNSKLARGDMNIGKSSSRSARRNLLSELKASSALLAMQSSHDHPQPMNMSGKMIPPFQEPDFAMESPQLIETQLLTGSRFGDLRSAETFLKSSPLSEFSIIARYDVLVKTMHRLVRLFEQHTYFGVILVLASRKLPGNAPVWRLILRIPDRYGGTVMRVKSLLSLTNFEVELTLPICSDGRTGTHYVCRSKEGM